jgi:RHH-type proline utilization regulon transcriptional repressor/proline dehydrogenase/delta 1-pyrroline-5-carboxylate dehydrogenase
MGEIDLQTLAGGVESATPAEETEQAEEAPSAEADIEDAAMPTDETLEEPGYFVQPHIFADVPIDSTIAQDEIFGPVLAVIRVRTFDEALESALRVRYALTGGVYSRNPAHIMRAAREFRVGNLYINRPITGAVVGRQPFGGSRMSGVGSKAGGPITCCSSWSPVW